VPRDFDGNAYRPIDDSHVLPWFAKPSGCLPEILTARGASALRRQHGRVQHLLSPHRNGRPVPGLPDLADALDLFALASYVHRRIDTARLVL